MIANQRIAHPREKFDSVDLNVAMSPAPAVFLAKYSADIMIVRTISTTPGEPARAISQ